MKKSKIITGLSAGFMAAIALSSCSLIKSNGDIVLTIGGESYTANDLFKGQKSAAAGEAKFNAVYKVAVRQYFTKEPGSAKMDQIKKDTQNKISGQKDTAQSNASKNGTSYDTEWNKILTSNGVEDEQGLYDKFEYELQKTEFDDQFYEKNLKTLQIGGKLEGSDIEIDKGYIKKKHPYHVKHILVKVSAAAGDPTTGEITESEAIKLSKVVQALAEGKDFGLVAELYSDDTGSAKNLGDLGIMDMDTSFVNEFKLGTYMYESYFGSSTTTAKEKLGLNDATTKDQAGYYASEISKLADSSGKTAETGGDNTGIGQIPYEAALLLGKGEYKSGKTGTITGKGSANIDYTSQGFSKVTNDNKAKYYPRNVIFNKYFNKNNIMVITPRKVSDSYAKDSVKTYVNLDDSEVALKGKKRIADDNYLGVVDKDIEDMNGFSINAKNDDVLNKKLVDSKGRVNSENQQQDNNIILRDNEGRTIFVFRSGTTGDSSYQGIHFVSIERSPFIDKEYETGETKEGVAVDEYFTWRYPGQEGGTGEYPTYKNKESELYGKNKLTYVNYINDPDKSALKTRADAVKTKIKSFDANLNTYVYDYLIKTGGLKFADTTEAKEVETSINTWIERKRESTKYETEDNWNKTWKTYYQKLEETTKRRKPVNIGEGEKQDDWIGGTISEACAIAYMAYDANDATDLAELQAMFDKGGVFHE